MRSAPALRILDTIEELRGEGLELAVRAAVTTGEAVVALGARPERGEGIVTGDVVNTAARLQSAAPVGAVIVDETTMRSTESGDHASSRSSRSRRRGRPSRSRSGARLDARSRVGQPEAATHSPFVGREHERTLLARDVPPRRARVVGAARHGRRRAGDRQEPPRHRASRRRSTSGRTSSPGVTGAACPTARASRSGRSARS